MTKGERKIPTSPLLKAIRRAKTLRGSKFSLSGKIKTGHNAPKPITLRLPPEKR